MFKKFYRLFSPTTHPNLIFWGSYLTLNCLLFLPQYLLNQEATFFPFSTITSQTVSETAKQLLLWRNNLDMFRLNGELLFLIAIWVYLPWWQRPVMTTFFRWLCGLLYFAMLIYAGYESIMLTLYQTAPVFYSHWQLAIDGIQVLWRNLDLPLTTYLVGAIGMVMGTTIIITLIRQVIGGVAATQLNGWSKAILGVLACLTIGTTLIYQHFLTSPKMQVSSFTFKVRQNLIDSTVAYRRVQAFNEAPIKQTDEYSKQILLQKPNIHLIFIESYGSVLYKRPDYLEMYTALSQNLAAEYRTQDWFVYSTLSEAPTWGGGSWMSYTSALFGLRVDTQPQYLALLERYQTESYPDLGHYLKGQGYDYIRLSSLSTQLKAEKQQQLQNFYGIDQWPNYNGLNYEGAHFGWGPAPPDQYALFHTYETILSKSTKPFLFFYITQNSHYPWVPLPEVVDDWRILNQPAEPIAAPVIQSIPHQEKRQNYFNSIHYELRFLTDYIFSTGTEDDIYVLIGDHQPPQVSRENDSFDTPVHIISRNEAFVARLAEYGFEPGLLVSDLEATMHHEDFYTMFVGLLLAQYGTSPSDTVPGHLSPGLIVENEPGIEINSSHLAQEKD